MQQLVSSLLLIGIVLAGGVLLYTLTINSIPSIEEAPTFSPLKVYSSFHVPPSWFIIKTDKSVDGFLLEREDKALEPLKVYEWCNKGCTYIILSPYFCEDVSSVLLLPSSQRITVECSPPLYYSSLDYNDGWSIPSSPYDFKIMEDGVRGRYFLLETNTTTVPTWSWMRKYFTLPGGFYIVSIYMGRNDKMIAEHVPLGSPQFTQINNPTTRIPSYNPLTLRASSFILPDTTTFLLTLNAGWSVDGNIAQAYFDELRIYPHFKYKVVNTLLSVDNNASLFEVDGNTIISEVNGWLKLEINDGGVYTPFFDLNTSMYVLYEIEFNNHPILTSLTTYVDGNASGLVINNCGYYDLNGILRCSALYQKVEGNTSFRVFISAYPRPATLYIRNVRVYEIVPQT